jgi:hypothetical protein
VFSRFLLDLKKRKLIMKKIILISLLRFLFDFSMFLFLSLCQLGLIFLVLYKLDLYLRTSLIPIILTLLIITVFYVSHFTLKRIHKIKIINVFFDKSTSTSFFSELTSLIVFVSIVMWYYF